MSDLPPLNEPHAWVVVGPGADGQKGPYALELLIGEVLAGRLFDATPVWWPGLAEWTTMSGHPALAAEIARRRAGYADPAAFAPAPVAPAPVPGQYQEASTGWETSTPQQPTVPVSGQDYSADMYVGDAVAVNPVMDPAPAAEPVAPVTTQLEAPAPGDVQPAEAVGATELHGDVVAAEVAGGDTADVPSTGATATEVLAPDSVEPPAPGGPDQGQRDAFDDLVNRSASRAEAVAAVDAVDAALAEGLSEAVARAGLSVTDRTDGPDVHEVRCSGDEGETLTVTLGRVAGQDLASVRDTHVPLEVRCTNVSYGGGVATGTGAHGEVVVAADEWSGQATSGVALLLPVADYLGADGGVDSGALVRDVDAVVAVVRHRLR